MRRISWGGGNIGGVIRLGEDTRSEVIGVRNKGLWGRNEKGNGETKGHRVLE